MEQMEPMNMLKGIANGTPTWVWALLLVLGVVGVLSMRRRVSPVWIYYLVPFMGIFAWRAVGRLPATPEIWGLFAASYGVGALAGWRIQPRWIIRRDGGRVELRGEALTLPMILIVFAANFVVGTMTAIAPQVVASLGFQAGFVLVEGLTAGVFLGRTLAIAGTPDSRAVA